MYAWLYQQTGSTKYRDMADTLFEGGVKGAWIMPGCDICTDWGPAKQYNQNYRWSFDYVKWRFGVIPLPPGITPAPLPSATPATTLANIRAQW
jgi:hypothetical protein